MKEKNNIDRLFQEQLKDFEATPDHQVWLNIEAELKKDKKRKVIPIWFKYAGIAAAFFLGLFALNTLQIFDSKTENRIVLNNMSSKDSLNKKQIHLQKSPKEIQKEGQLVSNSTKKSSYESKKMNSNFIKSIPSHEKEITSYDSSKTSDDKKKNQNNAGFPLSKNNLPLKQLATNESNSKYNSLIADKNGVTNSNAIENTKNETLAKTEKDDSKKQSLTTPESPNELEEILKTKLEQKKAIVANSKNKWQITPNIGQVYLNANSGGSPIDNQLSDYEKKSDKSISFGIGIQYAVSNKVALRTGINKVVLGYNTNNVLYSAGLTASNLANINYISNNAIKFANQTNYYSLPALEKEIQNTNTGTLNQKMGYYELPIELSYAVLNKKFGITIIGGFSTLFLNENTISLVSPQSNTQLGEAKNLNKIHLSTNLGFGFKYQLIKSFQLRFEPILKYQFNTFSKDSNNFKPVYIGLYSGVSYQF